MTSEHRHTLEVANIWKGFGGVRALQGASLTIPGSKVTALVGDNGAGKSTLVRIMTGVTQPDSGTITLGGVELNLQSSRHAAKAGIHTVFQDLALVGSMTVSDNLFLCREPKRKVFGWQSPLLDRHRMQTASKQALSDLGISTVADVNERVEYLSGGQRQAIAIARAVRDKAQVVILDEPTAALGVAQAAQVLALVDRLRSAGTAVLVVSHNLREVFTVSDYVAVMRLGKVVEVFRTSATTEEMVVATIVGSR
jgi:D-xylose transport system ATP-binding protein